MSTLVNIGEFARLTHLSVKALRHYHDVGVLVPIELSASGYRRYDVAQVADAHLIRRLRLLDMPLPDIEMVLAAPSATERDAALARHLRRMEDDLARTREIVSSLRELLERPVRLYEVTLRREESTVALVRRATVDEADIEAWSAAAFADLDAALVAIGLDAAGPMGSLFAAEFFEHGRGEVTAFAPLPLEAHRPAAPLHPPHGLAVEVVPGGDYAVATHTGPYSDLDRTYGALGSHVAEHFVAAAGPIREHYVISAADVDDDAGLRTELLWPTEFAGASTPPVA